MSATDGARASPCASKSSPSRGPGARSCIEVSLEIPPGEVTDPARRERRRQVDARARDRRSPAPDCGEGAPRRRRTSPRARPEQIRAAGVAIVPEGRRHAPRPDGRGQPAGRDVRALARGAHGAASRTRSSSSRGSRRAGGAVARSLSGGEQQMVVLAQALVSRPKILVVDELSLGLAPIVVKSLVPTLEEVAAAGVGVLLIEQFAHVALASPTQAYVLEGGRIRYHGHRRGAQAAARRPPAPPTSCGSRRPAVGEARRRESSRHAAPAGVMELVDVPEPGEPGRRRGAPQARRSRALRLRLPLLPRRARLLEVFPRIQGHEFSAVVEAVGPDCPAGARRRTSALRSGRSAPAGTATRAGSGARTCAST